jgi:putative ABC transport system permease protein
MRVTRSLLHAAARCAVALYPADFRARFGGAMRQAFVDRVADRARSTSPIAATGFAVVALWNIAANGAAERLHARRRAAAHERVPLGRMVVDDVRYALRMMWRAPAPAVLSILTLAVGIGAAATVYGLVDATLLRPPDLPAPDRVVAMAETLRGQAGQSSYENIRDWQRQTRTFEAIAGVRPQSVNLTGLDRPDRVRGGFVTSGIFQVAGVAVARGRALEPRDDEPNAAPVAVINDSFWQRRFGGAPDILGRVVQLNNVGFEIVGVMPSGFSFPFDAIEVWLPARHLPGTLTRGARSFMAFGRLRPGVTLAQGQADLDAIGRSLADAFPATNKDRGILATDLHAWLTTGVAGQLGMVMALVVVLLVAACANVASLQVGALAKRTPEIAVRLALGAGRRRLLRQLLTEQLVVAGIAGGAGLLLAAWMLPAAAASAPVALFGLERVALDGRVVAFTIAMTLAAGLTGGAIPAWRWTWRAASDALRSGGRTIGDRRATATRSVLVAAQVALSMVLLVASGLLVKSYSGLLAIDPGFRGDRVVTLEYRLPANKYTTPTAQAAFHEAVVERVRAVPGVIHAAGARGVPLSGNGDTTSFTTVKSATADPPRPATLNTVTDDYFQTLGIPLVRGRFFDARDRAGAPPVVIVSERFARDAWPGEDPIGQTVVLTGSDLRPQVIGVVGDLRHFRITDDPQQTIYARNAQNPGLFMTVAAEIGGSGDPMAQLEAIRRAVWSVDPDQPVWKERTVGSLVAASTQGTRFLFITLAIFAASSLLLVVAGLYGVVSQGVAQQSREIGVKMMLGADRAGILRQVLGWGLRMTGIGLALGLAGAAAASQLLRGSLYQMSPLDAGPYAIAMLVLAAVAVAACYLPARRAATIEPMAVLRDA